MKRIFLMMFICLIFGCSKQTYRTSQTPSPLPEIYLGKIEKIFYPENTNHTYIYINGHHYLLDGVFKCNEKNVSVWVVKDSYYPIKINYKGIEYRYRILYDLENI